MYTGYRSKARPRWMRIGALFSALLFTWMFLLWKPLAVMAQPPPKNTYRIAPLPPPAKPTPPPASLRQNLKPLTPDQVARLNAHRAPTAPPLTLLDEVGRLRQPGSTQQVEAWKQQLHAGAVQGEAAAKLHIWLGEWELAQNEQPEIALWHFGQASHLSRPSQVCYGLAGYDRAIALLYRGAYQQSAE